MNVLLLAPQPFYQERGTPIAVDMVLNVLSERGEHVDVLTYHEGEAVTYDNVAIYRIPQIPFIKGIRPGFSWKKALCDGLMLVKAVRMASGHKYRLVHAVEESVFLALALKWMFGVPYIYDMDSSLKQQLVEKLFIFRLFIPFLTFFERLAVRNALAIVPVCDALAENIVKHQPKQVMILRDVSLLNEVEHLDQPALREELGITSPILMYVGNLESYQGIDLMLESFALAQARNFPASLVIIGGNPSDIKKYQEQCVRLGVQQKVYFLGPKPVANLASYLFQADVLISPRIKGQNTPMKLYSYLHSGKAVLATNLTTHTQLLGNDTALLTDPTPPAFSEGMSRLVSDEPLRLKLGLAGRKLIEEKYSFPVFRRNLDQLYDWVSAKSDEPIAA